MDRRAREQAFPGIARLDPDFHRCAVRINRRAHHRYLAVNLLPCVERCDRCRGPHSHIDCLRGGDVDPGDHLRDVHHRQERDTG